MPRGRTANSCRSRTRTHARTHTHTHTHTHTQDLHEIGELNDEALGRVYNIMSEFYMFPRNKGWYFNMVESVAGDLQYLRYFRLSRYLNSTPASQLTHTHTYTHNTHNTHTHKHTHTHTYTHTGQPSTLSLLVSKITSCSFAPAHARTSVEEQLAMFLMYAASSDLYETVSAVQGFSRSSVSKAVKEVLCVIQERLGVEDGWVRPPSSVEEGRQKAAAFETVGSWSTRGRGAAHTPGIPQVVGAMDGTHITLTSRPANTGDDRCLYRCFVTRRDKAAVQAPVIQIVLPEACLQLFLDGGDLSCIFSAAER